jgi:hypothetical protein
MVEVNEPTISDKYAAVFSGGFGREVLADILIFCHYWDTLDPENKAQVAQRNVGVWIAAQAGYTDSSKSLLGIVKGQ